MRRLALILSLVLVVSCASFGRFTDGAKTVLSTLEQAAQLLCLFASAENVGKSVDEIRDDCCRTKEEIQPWLDAARTGARAGAVRAGMSEPLTPENAEPALKTVPDLEQRK